MQNILAPILCKKCNAEIIWAKSQDSGDITKVLFHCECGTKNYVSFMGDPLLMSSDGYYFEYVDEREFKCLKK